MAAMEPLCQIFGISSKKLTRNENIVLEANLFLYICEHLQETIKNQYKDYLYLLKFDQPTESFMIENELVRCILKDILLTEEYSLAGIACYTNTPEDVIHEVITGNNNNPSFTFSRRIIELHKTVRPEIYAGIFRKIADELSH